MTPDFKIRICCNYWHAQTLGNQSDVHLILQKIAITSKKPQTTRNRIQTVYTCEKGQIVF